MIWRQASLPARWHASLPSLASACARAALRGPGTVLTAHPASFRVTLLEILMPSWHSAPATSPADWSLRPPAERPLAGGVSDSPSLKAESLTSLSLFAF